MHLPITLLTASIAGLMLIGLSVRVIGSRVTGEVLIGDGSQEDLLYKIRTHANFIEYVPLFLILLGLVESAGGNTTVLMIIALVFIVARALHVLGMGSQANLTFRQLGMVGTFLSIATMSFYGIYLGGFALGSG